MSPIFISHLSAFLIYRNNRNKLYPETFPITKNRPKKTDHYNKNEIIEIFNIYKPILNNNLDILVSNPASVHHLKDVKFHKHNIRLPQNSFLKLSKDTYISSPELAICQLAETFPITKLWLTCLEFCGTYSIDQSSLNGFSSMKAPITNVNKLKKFIKLYNAKYNNLHGMQNLSKIQNCLKGKSASPQESKLYIILTAPRSIGGFGVKNLVLNQSVELSKKASDIGKQQTIYPDISNPKHKLSIEYDSNAFHNKTNQNEKDKLRLGALQHDKWKVFSIVPKQINNPNTLYNIAIDILKANKQDTRITTKNFWNKYLSLYNSLYDK